MNPKALKTERDYQAALTHVEALMDKRPSRQGQADRVRSLDAQLSAHQQPFCAPLRRQAT